MKTKDLENQVDEFAALNYTIVLRQDEEGDVVASIKELQGCVAHGQDAMEALGALESMKRLWVESCLRDGGVVPLPEEDEELPSGKWLQRAPRTLHRKLIEAATQEGVSLNSFVCTCLAEAVGSRMRISQPTSPGILNTLIGAAAVRVEPIGNWVLRMPAHDKEHSFESAMIQAIAPPRQIPERKKREDQQASRSFAYQA